MKRKRSPERVVHPFEPYVREDSQILILGSVPSVASRAYGFFYGHPQNRFWKMLSAVFNEPFPSTIDDKKQLLEKHKIALYDSIKECTILGSSDSSIRDVVPSDIESILKCSKITKILSNGKASEKYFLQFQKDELIKKLKVMPSTSPANASYNLAKLIEIWRPELTT